MGGKRKEFDFCDDVKEFLEQKKSESTFYTYRSGLVKFKAYYRQKHGQDKTIADFLDAVDRNRQLPRRQQKRLAETELNSFIKFLETLPREDGEVGYPANSIRTYLSAVQNLMLFHRLPVSMKFVNIPEPVVEEKNEKHEWKLKEIREFVGKATTHRDKAIILSLFQSGLGENELCELDYGDVRKGLENGILPLCLKIVRKKTKVKHRTFFGRDAVHYLKLYLETRNSITDKSPLFTKLGSKKRITDGAIQARFREIAEKCSFVSDKDLNEGYNPARPHSLRSAFRSRLTNKVDPVLIKYLMGHKLAPEQKAYLEMPTDELRQLYANHEHLLSIEKTSKDEYSVATDKGKEVAELRGKIRNLEETIGHLSERMEEQKRLITNFGKVPLEFLEKVYEEYLRTQELEDQKALEEEQDRIMAGTGK